MHMMELLVNFDMCPDLRILAIHIILLLFKYLLELVFILSDVLSDIEAHDWYNFYYWICILIFDILIFKKMTPQILA